MKTITVNEGLIVGPDQFLVIRCSPMTTRDVLQRFRDDLARQYPTLSPRTVIIACEELVAIDAEAARNLPIAGTA